MSVDITIPSVGESVSSGFITQWHKADGEMVNSGDLLLTLDTDKISTEIAAESAGVLEILVPEGQDVEIGAVVGKISSSSGHTKSPEIAEEKENVSDGILTEENKSNSTDKINSDEPEVFKENIDQNIPTKTIIEEEKSNDFDQKEIEYKEKKRDLRLDRKAPVSPAVKTLAKDKGVDLALVKGTGKKGAILKKDVLAYLDGDSSESSIKNVSFQRSDNTESTNIPNLDLKPIQHQKPSPPQEEEGGRITRKPLSPIRRKIANHLVSAQRDSALLTMQ